MAGTVGHEADSNRHTSAARARAAQELPRVGDIVEDLTDLVDEVEVLLLMLAPMVYTWPGTPFSKASLGPAAVIVHIDPIATFDPSP